MHDYADARLIQSLYSQHLVHIRQYLQRHSRDLSHRYRLMTHGALIKQEPSKFLVHILELRFQVFPQMLSFGHLHLLCHFDSYFQYNAFGSTMLQLQFMLDSHDPFHKSVSNMIEISVTLPIGNLVLIATACKACIVTVC